MQIIGGRFRGKKLLQVTDDTTRSTTCRVRENIFNLISANVRGSRILDLFSGCGAFSCESISRGANSIVANDNCIKAYSITKKNLESIHATNTQVFNLDYQDLIRKKQSETFDIIFLDPPYNGEFGEHAIHLITKYKMLNKNGIIVFETNKDIAQDSDLFNGFDVRIKKYGIARVHLLTPQPDLPPMQ